MNILPNNVDMLFVLMATTFGFLAYSAFTVRRHGAKAYFEQLGRGIVLAFVLLGKFLNKAVGLLAQSAKTQKFGKESDIAPSGGVLNYRTGKLDDGTDPVGWYEKD